MMIPPKKSKDKGSQGKKTADVSQEIIDVSEESEPEPAKKKTGSRSTRDVVIQDTPNTMQALKESKKTSKRQPSTGGLSEGTGRIPGVPDESTVVSITSCEGTGTKPRVPDEEKKDKDGYADDESDYHISDTQDIDNEDAENKSYEDEIYKYKIRVRKDVDVEMAEPKTIEHGNKEKDVMTDAAKPDV
ncbi:hypothetical protein Tco_1564466 [Tanacetum coccineum]